MCASSCLLLPLLPGHRRPGAAMWCCSPGNRAATRLAKILPRRPLDLLLYGFSVARHMQIFNLIFNSALWASEPEAKSYQLAWKRDFPCKQQAQRRDGKPNSQHPASGLPALPPSSTPSTVPPAAEVLSWGSPAAPPRAHLPPQRGLYPPGPL